MIPPTISLSVETTNDTSAANSFVPPSCHGPWPSPKKRHKNVLLGFAVGVVGLVVLKRNDRKRIPPGFIRSRVIAFVLLYGTWEGSTTAPPSVASSTEKTAG